MNENAQKQQAVETKRKVHYEEESLKRKVGEKEVKKMYPKRKKKKKTRRKK